MFGDDSPILCTCGCGQPVKRARYPSQQKRYINGHQHRGEHNGNYRGGKEARTCPICSAVFYAFPSQVSVTCGRDECYRDWQGQNSRARGRQTITIFCDYCGKTMDRPPSLINERNYCDRVYQGAARTAQKAAQAGDWRGGTIERDCAYCGRRFKGRYHNGQEPLYCSRRCHHQSGQVELTCATCGRIHTQKASKADSSNYCSLACREQGKAETKPERLVREALIKIDIAFEQQKQIGPYTVDFYLPECNIVIEVDGDYWHSLAKAIFRDRSKDTYLQRQGMDVVRIKESELKTDNPVRVVGLKLTRILEDRLGE